MQTCQWKRHADNINKEINDRRDWANTLEEGRLTPKWVRELVWVETTNVVRWANSKRLTLRSRIRTIRVWAPTEWCCSIPWALIQIKTAHRQPSPGPAGARIQKKPCETRFNKMDDRNRASNRARSAPDTIGSGLNKEVMAPRLLFPNRSCWLVDSSP